MRFGIIGGGMIANFHAEAISRLGGCELYGVYARRPGAARILADKYGCAASSDLDSFLQDPKLDIVTIATPSGAHLEPVVAAARAGKHVICEKPLEVTVDRIDRMIAECSQAGVTLAGIFNRRFHPTMQLLKSAASNGRFGRITLCSASVRWFRDQEYYESGVWRGTWSLDGGGALMNQAIHAVDQLLYVAGAVVSVQAYSACLAHQNIEVEDTAVAVLEFESGALGTIQAATTCWSAKGNPAEIVVCGTDGTVVLEDERFRTWEFRTDDSDEDETARQFLGDATAGAGANDPSSIVCDGHVRNFADVVSAIRDGQLPLVDGHEARKSVAVIQSIYESAAGGGVKIAVDSHQ